MNLLGRNKADLLRRSNRLFNEWLCIWLSELKVAYWKDSNEVSGYYPTIKKLENDEFVFQAGDSGVFVKVMISFQYSSVLILDIKEDC